MGVSTDRALAAETAARVAAIKALSDTVTAANAAAAYRLWRDLGKFDLNALAAGTYVLAKGLGAVAAATDGSGKGAYYLDPATQAVTGRTAKANLKVGLLGQGTNPGCSLTTSLVLASTASGSNAPRIALGSAPSPSISVAQTPSGTGSKTPNGSGDIDVSGWSATWYVLQLVVGTGGMAAGSQITLDAQLEVRNV